MLISTDGNKGIYITILGICLCFIMYTTIRSLLNNVLTATEDVQAWVYSLNNHPLLLDRGRVKMLIATLIMILLAIIFISMFPLYLKFSKYNKLEEDLFYFQQKKKLVEAREALLISLLGHNLKDIKNLCLYQHQNLAIMDPAEFKQKINLKDLVDIISNYEIDILPKQGANLIINNIPKDCYAYNNYALFYRFIANKLLRMSLIQDPRRKITVDYISNDNKTAIKLSGIMPKRGNSTSFTETRDHEVCKINQFVYIREEAEKQIEHALGCSVKENIYGREITILINFKKKVVEQGLSSNIIYPI